METVMEIAGIKIELIEELHISGQRDSSYVKFAIRTSDRGHTTRPMRLEFDVSDVNCISICNKGKKHEHI